MLRHLIGQNSASFNGTCLGGNSLKLQYGPITRALVQRPGSTWQNKEWNPISAAANDQAET